MKKHKCAWCGEKFIPTVRQRGCKTSGLPTYCPDKNCYRIAHNLRMKEIRKGNIKVPAKTKKKCEFCGKEFMPYHWKQKYCSTYHSRGCAYKAALKHMDKYYQKKLKEKPTSGRRCQMCGRDPKPNYYFCPPCHSKISSTIDYDEHCCSFI